MAPDFITPRIVDMVERAYREGYREAARDGRLPPPDMQWTFSRWLVSRARGEVVSMVES